jgi:hypothetical protein
VLSGSGSGSRADRIVRTLGVPERESQVCPRGESKDDATGIDQFAT